ncbi:hypothetical protein H8I91_21495 [Serratia fonticola]|uniref:hypothetical protein n=1 Tax=Serratia fonticola TaxID=47917 RepID=UPI001648947C|nr:hypothetical protein [Serratia fonticola]MBC3252843.1 hypothetical protein [Serratia fonticola]
MSWRTALKALVIDPKTGELSTAEVMTVGAFVVSSIMVLNAAFTQSLAEYEFIGYLAVWALHSQATRLVSLQRDRQDKNDDPAG